MDTIEDREWMELFNRMAQHVDMKGTHGDKAEYDRRWKLYKNYVNSELRRVKGTRYKSEKLQLKRIKELRIEIKNLDNFNSTKGRITGQDGIFERATESPEGEEGLVLRYGYNQAKDILLSRQLDRIGRLKIVSKRRTARRKLSRDRRTIEQEPFKTWRWRRANAYDKRKQLLLSGNTVEQLRATLKAEGGDYKSYHRKDLLAEKVLDGRSIKR